MTPNTNIDEQIAENTQALKGQALEQLMDRLEADLEESNSSAAADLLTRLRAQPLHPDSIDAVARLHTLWMRAGDAAAARAVLDADGTRLLSGASGPAYADIRMQLALYRLQIAHYLDEEDAVSSALAQMRDVVKTEPALVADRYRRVRVLDNIERERPSQALTAIELRNALNLAVAERAPVRAWDEADYHVRRAWVHHRQGDADAAREAAEAGVTALASASADQSIDASDWLRVGDAVIEIAPLQLAAIERAVTALTADWSLPQRRETEVRVARLAARAAYAQGDLAGALSACDLAHISLEPNGSDDFLEYELPWLLEAGRFDEAGQRAFFHIYEFEQEMWESVGRTVHERLADPADTSVWWALCAVRACNTAPTLARLAAIGSEGGQDLAARSPVHAQLFAALASRSAEAALETVSDAARSLAEQRAPGHPWTARLGAVHDFRAGRIDAKTQVARITDAIARGGLGNKRTASALLMAQHEAIGLRAAFKQPAPTLESGMWCYQFGCAISDYFVEHKDSVPEAEHGQTWEDIQKIQIAVYEQGRAHLERFFETGKGHWLDGCAHLYSMLCNNLGIAYRYTKRYEEALDVHQCGIAASPFAEHFDGILSVRRAMEDDAAIVEAAERLWHFADEHGYSRHDPHAYIADVLNSLYELGRTNEMLIWLERLVKWQQQELEVDEENLPDDALAARLAVTVHLALGGHADAAGLVQRLRPQAENRDHYPVVYRTASTFYYLGWHDDAKAWYERALAINHTLPEAARYKTDILEARIAECSQAAGASGQRGAASKPWWKFWR
ncbi:hypothetical protein C0Z18_29660 [Trinickia dabaoshanensis]|uniref:Tetratricopeptide repeat protein n=1 Tax=Trinickia dabaoshanensis TaxID=564714 RepID=A0A2N7VCM1_9BURK|nr:hypothetical protein [Trinickia dabaoshanensis]PMS14918.1 hypothetical protein C0Z18_29660 [Trinickia dabaoshanensis]